MGGGIGGGGGRGGSAHPVRRPSIREGSRELLSGGGGAEEDVVVDDDGGPLARAEPKSMGTIGGLGRAGRQAGRRQACMCVWSGTSMSMSTSRGERQVKKPQAKSEQGRSSEASCLLSSQPVWSEEKRLGCFGRTGKGEGRRGDFIAFRRASGPLAD